MLVLDGPHIVERNHRDVLLVTGAVSRRCRHEAEGLPLGAGAAQDALHCRRGGVGHQQCILRRQAGEKQRAEVKRPKASELWPAAVVFSARVSAPRFPSCRGPQAALMSS